MGDIQNETLNPKCSLKIIPSICTINISNIHFMGFLIKLFIKENNFFCLMTNSNLITEEMVRINRQINFSYDDDKKNKIINLNIKERYIEFFHEIETVIIEIIDNDRIKPNYFLSIDETCGVFTEAFLKNYPISVVGLMKDSTIGYVNGRIIEVNNNEFTYIVNNENLKTIMNVSPIFSENKTEVIGITKIPKENISGKKAYSLGSIYKYFKEKIEFENLQDGGTYFGLLKNDIPNGHGLYHFQNGEIYYGDIINDKFDGKGKYIYTNGEYYIGQWKNNLRYGKGILYYSNHNIKYDGDFKEDKYEGNGKYYYENGEYYLGQFKNNYNDGKGIIYYSNGNIKYEGYFVNDKFDGDGKYVYEDGVYYIGHFKNGLKHGKGKLFNRDGNIIYEGIFNNGN